ncbi:hypothetical protein D3C85_1301070 [compost metagenome]
MPAPFLHPVRIAREPQHEDGGGDVGNGRVQADLHRVLDAGDLEQRGQPEADGVDAANQAEVGEGHAVDGRVAQHLCEGVLFLRAARFQIRGQQRLFAGAEPAGLGGFVVQEIERHHAQQHAGQAFQQEHPLPAFQTMRAREGRHDPGRRRAADNAADGAGQHHHRHDARHA